VYKSRSVRYAGGYHNLGKLVHPGYAG
jgi:hypothetical protein